VLGRVGVGTGDEHAPLGVLGATRPHLLTGDHPFVALPNRPGLHRGQIRAGVGLGEPLTPDLLGSEDRAQVAFLLRGRPPGHDRRTGEQQSEHVGRQRCAGAAELLEEDRRLGHRRAAAAVLDRPVDGRPAVVGQPALEVPAPVVVGVLVAGGLRLGLVGGKPVTQLVAEGELAVTEREVHLASFL
jgi:hypothetical protein